LLVEDDAVIGRSLHERLVAHRYDVVWVTTGADAVGRGRRGQFDLVLLDLGLPTSTAWTCAGGCVPPCRHRCSLS